MNEPADDSLTKWVVGSAAGGILALVYGLTKLVFGGVMKRLDEIKAENEVANREQLTEIRIIGATQQVHTTEIALAKAQMSRISEDFSALRVKYDDIVGFLQSQGYRKRDGHQ